jgi:hypothetical protein
MTLSVTLHRTKTPQSKIEPHPPRKSNKENYVTKATSESDVYNTSFLLWRRHSKRMIE